MHEQWVEPSKARADVLINSEVGHSVKIAVKMLANHMRVAGGLLGDETTTTGA
jgi:uridine kinase